LTVESWADLGIGIDERWRYWAVVPAPRTGDEFSKSKAVELVLAGDRWKGVLRLLAESECGATARRADLVSTLGYSAPPNRLEKDRRARPGAIEQALAADLKTVWKKLAKQLKDALGDLRRELRELVSGPRGRAVNCLRANKANVESGFVVRFLVQDDSGRLRFGQP
jgi:hypothetical protein